MDFAAAAIVAASGALATTAVRQLPDAHDNQLAVAAPLQDWSPIANV